MISKDQETRVAVAEQAAEWFVANDEGLRNAEEAAALFAWLRASPIHVEEFLRVAMIARDLPGACTDPARSAETRPARARGEAESPAESLWSRLRAAVADLPVRRWPSAAVALAALGVAAVALLLSWSLRPGARVAVPESVTMLHFVTGHGEQQTRRLADKSVLHLNTDTDVTVRYSRSARLVTLAAGETAFEVTHEAERPFRVLAGAAEVVDLGTRFDVRRDDGSTVVTVAEGRVAVAPSPIPATGRSNGNSPEPPRSVELAAGQQVTVARGAAWPATPVAVDATHTMAWLHRQIVFEGQPLGQVVAEFNRYAPKPIEIATPALQDLEISGVFSVDDSEAFVAFLRSLDGVQVEVTDTTVRVSRR